MEKTGFRRVSGALLAVAWIGVCLPSSAQLTQGAKAPVFRAHDIEGREVDLEKLLNQDLVILFFFSRSSGQELAAKLKDLHKTRQEKLPIVAVGLKEDEEALKLFARELEIRYYILKDSPEVSADSRYGPFRVLPMTFFIIGDGTVLNVIEGGGGGQAAVIARFAEAALQRARAASDPQERVARAEEAQAIAREAIPLGLDEKTARALSGYAAVEMGKLDQAEKEFEQTGDSEGLALVALKRGEFERAIRLAEQTSADSGYARTIKGEALLKLGNVDEALRTLESAATMPAAGWQSSEAYTHLGRLKQLQGDLEGALARYEKAQGLDALSVVALANQSQVLREKGDLEGAARLLDVAKARRIDDSLARLMMQQLQQDMERARETQRKEAVRKQVEDLVERYKTQKETGRDRPEDEWTSRPLAVAFLPGRNVAAVYFERAGMDVAVRRAIVARLDQNKRVRVVDREMIEGILDELNLGSSELADPNTQLRLGRLVGAHVLGFVDFAPAGTGISLFARLVDTETTVLKAQASREVSESDDLAALADEIAEELSNSLLAAYPLQGLVADVKDNEVVINLGGEHGVEAGQRFAVLRDEPSVEVGGRVSPRRPLTVGSLEVVAVEEQVSVCKVVPDSLRSGVPLGKGMKVKELPGP